MKTLKITTADYLDFNFATQTAKDLISNPKTETIGTYIAIAVYTGLRYSDLIKLDWSTFKKDKLELNEQKTGKARTITFSNNLMAILKPIQKNDGLIFTSQKGTPYTSQALNRILKDTFALQLHKKNISTHTMRKTFGRQIWELNGRSEEGLLMLMDIFGHSSLKITKAYLGITAEDRAKIYMDL